MTLDAALELAQSHHLAGRLQLAERIYRDILQAVPTHARTHYSLGFMALQRSDYQAAEERFRAAIRNQPRHVDSLVGLAVALHRMDKLAEAEQLAAQAVRLNPQHAGAHSVMGDIQLSKSLHSAATESLARAVALRPKDAPLMSSLLSCMTQDEAVDPDQLARMHKRFGKVFGANLRPQWPEHANARDPGKRLRVGYVSGDLREHAVFYFIEPVWNALDRRQIELFAYSTVDVVDAKTERLKALVDAWRPVAHLDDAQLTQQIVADGIDILIDVSGHTVHNRLLAFARKPAPVQASWLGYPETTGLTAIDYYLTDPIGAPPGPIDAMYTEKLVRLPASNSFRPDPRAPDVNPLPALQRGHLTFGSFNRLSKMGSTVLPTWIRILHQVPDARLLIAPVSDPAQALQLRQRFADQGVDGARLSFAPRQSMVDYLRLHHEVDILLDTFPYSGGTTTRHALWMGVPVVTLSGIRRTERISTANLTRVGLADWCVASTDAYVARAVAAANDLQGLAALRSGMRERILGSPLCQPRTIASGMEIAFRTMWRRWCEGLPAEAFSVSLEQALAS